MYGSDEEVALITEATALPGSGDDLRRAFVKLIPLSLAEGDVSTFRLHEDRDRPGHFTLYQRFRNQHGVDLHVQTDHFALSVEALAQFAEGGKSQVTFYHVLSRYALLTRAEGSDLTRLPNSGMTQQAVTAVDATPRTTA